MVMNRTRAVEVNIHALSPVFDTESAKQVIPVAKKTATAVRVSLNEDQEAFIIDISNVLNPEILAANGYQ